MHVNSYLKAFWHIICSTCIYASSFLCVCTYAYFAMVLYVYVYICMYTCMYIHICMYIYFCMYAYVCVCYVFVHETVCIYRLLPAYEGGIVFTSLASRVSCSKYDTSRGRRVVTHLSPNKRSKIHGENRCIFLKIFSVLQSSPVCLRYSESAIYGKKHQKM